jgi:hypothetical protein
MHPVCLCRACKPTDITGMICSRCGEEVRMGIRRPGVREWLHRQDVEHAAVLGHLMTFEAAEEVRRQREDVIRYMDDGTPYTTAEYEIKKDPDAARRKMRLAALRGEEVEEEEMPEAEINAHDVDPTTLPTGGIKQVVELVSGVTRLMPNGKNSKSKKHPPAAPGWELVSLRHWRGPYLGADGKVLGISDIMRVKARGPKGLDGSQGWAVASWRDGEFDFAYTGVIQGGRTSPTKVNSTTMKDWIKGNHDPDASEGDDRPGLGES